MPLFAEIRLVLCISQAAETKNEYSLFSQCGGFLEVDKKKVPSQEEARLEISPGNFHYVYVKYGKKLFKGEKLSTASQKISGRVGKNGTFYRRRILFHQPEYNNIEEWDSILCVA